MKMISCWQSHLWVRLHSLFQLMESKAFVTSKQATFSTCCSSPHLSWSWCLVSPVPLSGQNSHCDWENCLGQWVEVVELDSGSCTSLWGASRRALCSNYNCASPLLKMFKALPWEVLGHIFFFPKYRRWGHIKTTAQKNKMLKVPRTSPGTHFRQYLTDNVVTLNQPELQRI